MSWSRVSMPTRSVLPAAYSFANTITGGRISAINRDLTVNDRVMTLIQTDASINNGNSGGALINKVRSGSRHHVR